MQLTYWLKCLVNPFNDEREARAKARCEAHWANYPAHLPQPTVKKCIHARHIH